MDLIVHIPDEDYASELLSKATFDILRNRVEKYIRENNLGDEEKVYIYKKILNQLEEEEEQEKRKEVI